MNLIKSTGTFSFFTLVSRLTGYLRDILIAIFLGAGPIADAFFVAFRLPNTFRRLFSEGTFNAAFVPSYSSELNKSKKSAELFANNIFNILFLSLLAIVFIIEIFMPIFVALIAPGFTENTEKLEGVKIDTTENQPYKKISEKDLDICSADRNEYRSPTSKAMTPYKFDVNLASPLEILKSRSGKALWRLSLFSKPSIGMLSIIYSASFKSMFGYIAVRR